MQQSSPHACSMGHVGPRWTLGNSDRNVDQSDLETTGDYNSLDASKCGDDFKICKISKTPDRGDDSGFVETFHAIDADDPSSWRKDFMPAGVLLTTPNVCSTPIREPSFYFPRLDITGGCTTRRHSLLSHTHVSPVHPKSITNLPNGLRAFHLDKDGHDIEQATFCDADLDVITEKPISCTDPKTATELSRGHRTIASMLKSLPLNIAASNSTLTLSKEDCHFGCVSERPSVVHNTDVDEPVLIQKHADIIKSPRVSTDCTVKDYKYPIQNVALSKYCKQRILASSLHYSDISDGEETGLVDENNNVNETTPKYSDISDACASDVGSLVESLSSEEEVANRDIVTNKPSIRKGRKLSIPRRSASKVDPKFRGVTVWLQTSYHNGTSGLDISAFYSNVNTRSSTRRRTRGRNRWSSHQSRRWSTSRCWSCSDQEDGTSAHYIRDNSIVKTCASCKTRRTPLWRDAEDGTPLCNACGIRYKKYRLRCSKCWHIPKKEVKTYPNCPACGGSLRYSSHKKVW